MRKNCNFNNLFIYFKSSKLQKPKKFLTGRDRNRLVRSFVCTGFGPPSLEHVETAPLSPPLNIISYTNSTQLSSAFLLA